MSDLYPFENNFLELNQIKYHFLDEGQGEEERRGDGVVSSAEVVEGGSPRLR